MERSGDHNPAIRVVTMARREQWARQTENVGALVAYGVGEDGYRHLLGVAIGHRPV